MPLNPWKKIAESIVFKNPWWTYKRDTFELPSGGTGEYHYVHTNGSSMIVPIMDDGTLLLVNQYRYLVGKESLEFPCGSVKDGSTYDETAWHELVEETGYSAKGLYMIGEFNPYNGVTDEMCHVYIAKDLQHVGGTPDETEEFEVVTMTLVQLEEKIRMGIIWDGMTVAGWAVAKSKLEQLT
jgi:ADP-ribose pyrophosphatase